PAADPTQRRDPFGPLARRPALAPPRGADQRPPRRWRRMRCRRHLARLAGLGLVAALTACSSPNPNLYTIAPISASARSGARKVIELRQIGVARYLERSQIVRSSENYRLYVLANDWWGEPV